MSILIVRNINSSNLTDLEMNRRDGKEVEPSSADIVTFVTFVDDVTCNRVLAHLRINFENPFIFTELEVQLEWSLNYFTFLSRLCDAFIDS